VSGGGEERSELPRAMNIPVLPLSRRLLRFAPLIASLLVQSHLRVSLVNVLPVHFPFYLWECGKIEMLKAWSESEESTISEKGSTRHVVALLSLPHLGFRNRNFTGGGVTPLLLL